MKRFLISLLAVIVLSPIKSQEIPVTLGIGDPPPLLKYAKWIQGAPFELNKKEMIYVVEFWATWCGPCVAAMPHLSELSEKYKNDAKFIGVNIWEKVGEEPYESSLPKVMQFVEGSKKRMTYNVIADNNEQYMSSFWMRAAGQNGIPSTFVIRNNQIVWIGHPSKLDEVIPSLIAGTFDLNASKAQFAQARESSKQTMQLFTDFAKNINEAVAAKDYEKAFVIIDEGIKSNPMLRFSGKMQKLTILLDHFSEQKAIEYIQENISGENTGLEGTFASFLTEREKLSPATYNYAVKLIDMVLDKNKISAIYAMKANALIKSEQKELAIAALEKAIELGKTEVNDPKFAGRIFDYTIEEYQQKLSVLKESI